MSSTPTSKKKNNKLAPKRSHGYAVLLFILGTLFPPLAVAARFGIGTDFWLNLLLTICGYFPGHGHNFYIQNVRNNKNHARTPKWAQRYGLIDISEIKRKERKSQWATRYNERNPHSVLEGAPLEEGQQGDGSSVDISSEGHDNRRQNGELWRPEDESFYGNDAASSNSGRGSGRWHYPANFDDAAVPSSSGSKRKKEKKGKKDRWARTEDAYSMSEEPRRKKEKRKKKKGSDIDSTYSRDDENEFPEVAEGGLYGDSAQAGVNETEQGKKDTTSSDVFSHEF